MHNIGYNLNTKQKEILEFIYKTIETEHICPTIREIGKHVGLKSSATVQNHIVTMIDLGYLSRNPNKKRSLKVTDLAKQYCDPESLNSPSPAAILENLKTVPLVGDVQAGLPITAIENKEDDFFLPTNLTGSSDCFLLRVKGESMKNIGIFEGDMLLVRNQPTAVNGDVVVARIDDEATVKRFFKEDGFIRLQPENDEFEDIITKDCVIEGKVIGLIRDDIR